MYVSCATTNSLHWWIARLDADRLEDLPRATPRVAFPGDAKTGVKDPVIRLVDGTWHAWICSHWGWALCSSPVGSVLKSAASRRPAAAPS